MSRKKWGLRTLSALLTFALGLFAATIVKFRLGPTVTVQPAYDAANIKVQSPTAQVSEDALPLAEVDEIMQPHPVSISPYEIKRLMDENTFAAERQQRYELDLEPIWTQLGVKEDEIGFPYSNCLGGCEANIFRFDLDGKPGRETLLRLHAPTAMEYCFLIFNQQPSAYGQWTLLGKVNTFTWWNNAEHRVVSAGTKRWLVVGRTTGHGSSFGSFADDWYEVSENGVVRVLSYQTGLFVGRGANPMVSRKTNLVGIDYQDAIATLTLKSVTSYEGDVELHGVFPVFTTERKATFIKGPGMRYFVFDPLRSEIEPRELEPYFGDDAYITDEDFLKYNYRELATLIARGNGKQRDWLRIYLNTCNDTVEKQSLQKALEDEQP